MFLLFILINKPMSISTTIRAIIVTSEFPGGIADINKANKAIVSENLRKN